VKLFQTQTWQGKFSDLGRKSPHDVTRAPLTKQGNYPFSAFPLQQICPDENYLTLRLPDNFTNSHIS